MPIVLCTYKSCSKRGNWVITIYTLTSLSNGKRGNVRLIYAKSANIQKSQKLGLREKLLLHKSLKKLGPREKLLCTDVSENWDNTKNHSYIASKAGATTSLKKGGNREKCSKPAKIRITRPQKRRFSREILYISEISRYCHMKPKKQRLPPK